MGLGVPGWRQAPGARSGPGRWPLGMGGGVGRGAVEGFLLARHGAKYGSLPTPLEGPGAGRSTGPALG